MFRKYRRNADSELREVERRFLSSHAPADYQAYLVVCQRTGLIPAWCRCGAEAVENCAACTQRLLMPVRHCQRCSRHVCPGEVSIIGEEDQPCNREFTFKCGFCGEDKCTSEDYCSLSIVPENCRECEKQYCDSEDCGTSCDECGAPVCSECWFECEAHNNNHFCDDCTSRCEQCSNNCCPECVCVDQSCGVNICTDCSERDGVCTVCDGSLCETHQTDCSMCNETICDAHSKKCQMKDSEGSRCDAIICNQCDSISCHMCSRSSGCPSHFEECQQCENPVCPKCAEECPDCGETFDDDCLAEHQEGCFSVEKETQPTLVLPPPPPMPVAEIIDLRVGNRVRYRATGLLGMIIKISSKDGITKYIVEWDNDTAGKHLLEELEGPISSRRNYYRR